MSNRHIHVVLFEPEIAQNTGNIARTCAVVGATLHLVEPMGFRPTERNLKRAGCDYWDKVDIKHWASTGAFLAEHEGDEMYFFTGQSTHVYTDIVYGGAQAQGGNPCFDAEKASQDALVCNDTVNFDNEDINVYLIFGRERRGLDQDIIDSHLEQCVRIPMREGLRSLNLSNAVAIGVYEVVRQWQYIC